MKRFVTISILACLVACASKAPNDPNPTDPPVNPNEPANNTNSDTSNPSTSDGGSTSDPTPDSGTTPPPPVPTQASCLNACEAQHPKAAAENKTLDSTCMLGGACESVCNDLGTSKVLVGPTVDPDAGVVCDTVTPDSYPIRTSSAACSTCLANTPACCTLWIAIFGSADGRALNACANKCYADYAK